MIPGWVRRLLGTGGEQEGLIGLDTHCRRCQWYREVWHPQPGHSWDRCTRNNSCLAGSMSERVMEYCSTVNHDNRCPSFKPCIFLDQADKFEPQWWRDYY